MSKTVTYSKMKNTYDVLYNFMESIIALSDEMRGLSKVSSPADFYVDGDDLLSVVMGIGDLVDSYYRDTLNLLGSSDTYLPHTVDSGKYATSYLKLRCKVSILYDFFSSVRDLVIRLRDNAHEFYADGATPEMVVTEFGKNLSTHVFDYLRKLWTLDNN